MNIHQVVLNRIILAMLVILLFAAGSIAAPVKVTKTGKFIKKSACPSLSIISRGTLPDGTVGQLYRQKLQSVGGTAGVRWTLTPLDGNTLPVGLTLSPKGLLSGIPKAVGSWRVNISATDGCTPQQTVGQWLSLTVHEDKTVNQLQPKPQVTQSLALDAASLQVNPGEKIQSGLTLKLYNIGSPYIVEDGKLCVPHSDGITHTCNEILDTIYFPRIEVSIPYGHNFTKGRLYFSGDFLDFDMTNMNKFLGFFPKPVAFMSRLDVLDVCNRARKPNESRTTVEYYPPLSWHLYVSDRSGKRYVDEGLVEYRMDLTCEW